MLSIKLALDLCWFSQIRFMVITCIVVANEFTTITISSPCVRKECLVHLIKKNFARNIEDIAKAPHFTFLYVNFLLMND